MKIIYRYIIGEFIKPLFFSIAVFSGLVMISEFFRELNFFLENKTSFLYVFAYLLLNLPWWTIQVLPVAVLLAILFSLGQLARRGEITALKAAGVNLWRVIGTLFACAVLIGSIEIALREKVIPVTVKQAERIRHERIHLEKPHAQVEFHNLLVPLPGNGRMTIGYLNAEKNFMRGVIADYYDPGFNLTGQLVAQEAAWNGSEWIFTNGIERSFSAGGVVEASFEQQSISLPFQPKDFVINRVRPEQKSTKEYITYIRQLENLGVPVENEKIQFNQRWASVFSHVIVLFIGIPFALGFGSRHGKMISFTFALIFAFIYWGVQAVGQSMGENKVLSPLLAAWLGNFIFGIAGFYMLTKIQK